MKNSLLVTYKIVNFNQCKQLYCQVTRIVFWLFYSPSTAIPKIIQKCSCFLFLLNAVFHWSHNWSSESNTIWVNSILHLNTINKFQIRFKTPVTRFLRRRHSHSRRVLVSFIKQECFFLWYWVDCLSLNTNNCSFWKLNNRFWQCNSVSPLLTLYALWHTPLAFIILLGISYG